MKFGALLIAALSFPALAQTHFDAKEKDPFDLCVGLSNRLPVRVDELRALLNPEKAETQSDTCQGKPCELQRWQGRGYRIDLLVDSASGETTPASAEVTLPRWRFFTPLRVGMEIAAAESYFGFKRGAESAKIVIDGVCSTMAIDYRAGIIHSMQLDCHSCL